MGKFDLLLGSTVFVGIMTTLTVTPANAVIMLEERCVREVRECDKTIGATVDVLSKGKKISGRTACVPKQGVSQKQLREVVLTWLKAHPKEKGGDSVLVARALSEKFPCQ